MCYFDCGVAADWDLCLFDFYHVFVCGDLFVLLQMEALTVPMKPRFHSMFGVVLKKTMKTMKKMKTTTTMMMMMKLLVVIRVK